MKMQNGFTLIELLITVTIVGILTAIAVPAYTDHVIRGRLIEATASLSDGRVKMEQSYADNIPPAYGLTPCPASTVNFDYVCTNPGGDQTYLITANGKGSVADFSYTINDTNIRATTSLKSGWGTPDNCWITTKGGSC